MAAAAVLDHPWVVLGLLGTQPPGRVEVEKPVDEANELRREGSERPLVPVLEAAALLLAPVLPGATGASFLASTSIPDSGEVTPGRGTGKEPESMAKRQMPRDHMSASKPS